MANIHPHINFNGNAEEALKFYKSVFGGEFSKVMRFRDLPHSGSLIAANDADKIMYISLAIGPSVLIANDVPASMGKTNESENRSKISVSTDSRKEADDLFIGLSAGGEIEVAIGESPWGSYFGMFRDRFGIEWIINFDPKT